ncbi:MAG: hypothetical protein KBS61_08840 [Chryseobacterium sp.]|nr:hypothetical protein [Candidatus Chryseobacterium enterohippi]
MSIQKKRKIISTENDLIYKNKIRLLLWTEDENGDEIPNAEEEYIFIPTEDFDFVINDYKSVFPLINPWTEMVENQFDACGNNYFNQENMKIIIQKLKSQLFESDKVENFKIELLNWLKKNL